ncbi:MAG: hypothetical protein ACK4Z6_05760 [Candidatus Methylomirabilales bacterium]
MLKGHLSIPFQNLRLASVLHLPSKGRWPWVIASHGPLSTEESDKYLLGRELSRQIMFERGKGWLIETG